MSHKPGKGFTNHTHTDEYKAAHSLRMKGVGHSQSEETKKTIAEKARLRWANPEFRASRTKRTTQEWATWSSWDNMISRCTRPSAPNYKYYGERGIKVCAEWLFFDTFLEDMGLRPDGYTLDRLDPDGNYEPSNCRWATMKEQYDNNKRLIRDVKTGRLVRYYKSGE